VASSRSLVARLTPFALTAARRAARVTGSQTGSELAGRAVRADWQPSDLEAVSDRVRWMDPSSSCVCQVAGSFRRCPWSFNVPLGGRTTSEYNGWRLASILHPGSTIMTVDGQSRFPRSFEDVNEPALSKRADPRRILVHDPDDRHSKKRPRGILPVPLDSDDILRAGTPPGPTKSWSLLAPGVWDEETGTGRATKTSASHAPKWSSLRHDGGS